MAKKPKTSKKIELPLIKEITDFFGDYFTNQEDERWLWGKPKLPDYVSMNLKRTTYVSIRKRLCMHLITRREIGRQIVAQPSSFFHMATGSERNRHYGCYHALYVCPELGYQNFLFVVNTNSVISKTKENLLNPASKKYLFASNMVIMVQRLEIKAKWQPSPRIQNLKSFIFA